ncbi:MAG: TraR/DksA family transcriptional regulator [Spartobacteria bacterium]|nr:TraR/DksA family transcriptional regulator [Spartobacteria bacterium]
MADMTLKTAVQTNPLTDEERNALHDVLSRLRDHLVDEISYYSNNKTGSHDVSRDVSRSSDPGDQGSEATDMEMALSLVSNEHDALYEIEEALRRFDEKNYGICEECGKYIQKSRLEALPFARLCIRCKSEVEKSTLLTRGKRVFRR